MEQFSCRKCGALLKEEGGLCGSCAEEIAVEGEIEEMLLNK